MYIINFSRQPNLKPVWPFEIDVRYCTKKRNAKFNQTFQIILNLNKNCALFQMESSWGLSDEMSTNYYVWLREASSTGECLAWSDDVTKLL